jgi:hypothetical protein
MASKDDFLTGLTALTAVAGGVFIGYADSHSDDVFITLGILIGFSFLVGFLGPRRPWLWAPLVGIWVPVLDAVLPRFGLAPRGEPGASTSFLSFLAVLALVMTVCFAGAFAGAWLGRAARRAWQIDVGR